MFSDYQQALNDVFAERRVRNPSYSLRACARDLGIPAPNLSLILKRKRGMNLATAVEVANRLGLSAAEQQLFVRLVERDHARSPMKRQEAAAEIERTQPIPSTLTLDMLELIGKWHYFAVVEYLRLERKDSSAGAIAEALQISESMVTDAIERLLRLGLLQKKKGRLSVVQDYHWSPDGVPSEIIRKAHLRMLDKAKDAVTLQPIDERDCSFMMFGMDPKDIPEATRDLRNFLRGFVEKYSTRENVSSVYTLSMQLFYLTSNSKAGENP